MSSAPPGLAYCCQTNGHVRLEYVSPDCLQLTGFDVSALLANDQGLEFLIHPEDRAVVRDSFNEAARTGAPYRLTYRIVTAKGDDLWVVDQGHFQPGPDHQVLKRFGFLIDGSEQNRLAGVVHRHTDRLQMQQVIAAAANESDSTADALQSVLDIVCAYTGWPVGHVYLASGTQPVEMVSSEIWSMETPEKFSAFREATHALRFSAGVSLPGRVLQTGQVVWITDLARDANFRRTAAAADAGIRSAFAFPVLAGHEIVGVLEFFTTRPTLPDEQLLPVLTYVGTQLGRVVERDRAQAAMRQSEKTFRSLIENSSDLVTIVNADGTVRYESPSLERMLGYKPEELVGTDVFAPIHPDDLQRVQETFADGLRHPGSTRLERYRFRHRDGTWRTLDSIGRNMLGEKAIAGVIINTRDITKKTEAEAALRDSEERYRNLFESMHEGFALCEIICDECGQPADFRYLAVNSAFEPTTGLSNPIGKTVRQLIPDIEETWIKTYGTVALTGQPVRFERWLTPLNRCFEVAAFCPQPGQFAAIFMDVTERKLTEQKLRESDEKFRQMADNIDQVVWLANPDMSEVIYVSPAYERVWGRSCSSLYQNPRAWLDAIVPEDQAPLATAIHIENFTGYSTEYRIRRPDGSVRWILDRGFPIRDETGRLTRIAGVAEDITDRRRAEEELRKLSLAVEQSPASIVITNRAGTIEYVNPKFTEVTGYSPAEVVGQNPRVLKSGDRPVESYVELWRTISHGGTWSGEFHNKRKNGELFWEYAIISPIKDAQGRITHYVAVKEDITERKRISEELMASNLQLRQALDELQKTQHQVIQQERLRALGTMASGIAHDFNNALTSVLGFSELLLHRPENLADTAKSRRYLEVINTAALDAASVVSRLRKFYRHREEEETFNSVDLNQLVQEAISLTQPKWQTQTQAAGLDVQVQTALANVPMVNGCPADLREVLTNLIFNSVDAMPGGGTITLRTWREGQQVGLSVTDSGTGMTEEVRQHCLDPFYSTKGESGTGLGLSMVYGIVQRHAGQIEVQSTPGEGTTISIRFPVPETPGGFLASTVKEAPVKPLRLLLVDDEEPVCTVIREYLTGDGHTVQVANSGVAALEKFNPADFDMVIVDRAMPGMSGDQLAGAIKQRAPRIPVIMLTGFGAMMQAADEHPPGVDYIVSKPVTIQQLRAALAQAVRDRSDLRP